jgi:hypothetical protein
VIAELKAGVLSVVKASRRSLSRAVRCGAVRCGAVRTISACLLVMGGFVVRQGALVFVDRSMWGACSIRTADNMP